MKKIVALFLMLSMLLSVCVFAQADSEIELEFVWHKPEQASIQAMQAVVDAYNESHPGVRVVLNQIPDAGTALQARASTNELPDMFGCTTSTTYEIMFDSGLIMDLTGKDFLNNVEASTLALSAHDGKNWRLPYSLSAYGLYVRTDIFEQYGLQLPKTWDDLMACCETLKANGVYGFALPDKTMVYQRMERMMSFMSEDDSEFKAIAAGEMEAKDSTVLTAFAEASLQIAEYMAPESLSAEYTESYQMLLDGKAAMTINGQWSLSTLKDYNPDIKLAMIPLPNPIGENKVVVSIDTSICIATGTKYPEQCLDFLAYLSQTEVAQAYTDGEGSPCAINGVVSSIPELTGIADCMAEGKVCISQNAIWPSGFRKALGANATDLIIDGDIEAFYADAAETIDEYYNN